MSELSREVFGHSVWVGIVKFDVRLCLNETGGLFAFPILCQLSICTFRMNTPSLIALFVNRSAPDNLLVSLLPNLKSRRFLFAYEFLTQRFAIYVVIDHF